MRAFITSLAISLLIGLVAPTLALAQPDDASPAERREARRLWDRGMRLMGDDRWVEALELFRRARDLDERPSTVFNIATVLARLGRAREAMQAVQDLRRIADPAQDAELLAQGRQLERRLRGSFAQLELTVAPPNAEIRVDGELMEGSSERRHLLLDPGDHVIRISARGYSPTQFRLSALAGGRGEREILLIAERAMLVITSNVDDARVSVDGAEAGVGDVSLDVDPGPHHVLVTAGGYDDFERDIDIDPGQRLMLDASLESGGGGGLLSSPIFWIVAGVVVVGAIVGTIAGVAAASSGGEIYQGTAGFTLEALRQR